MGSHGSDCDPVGILTLENGYSFPELDAGVGVYANGCEVLDEALSSRFGGIPVERGVVEDVSSEDEEAITRQSTNPVVKAAFEINKNDRMELCAARQRLLRMQNFLERKGFSMADFDRENLMEDANFNAGIVNYNRIITGHDEMGLPIFEKVSGPTTAPNPLCDKSKANTYMEKMKQKLGTPPEVFEGLSDPKNQAGQTGTDAEDTTINQAKSWSQVVKNSNPNPVEIVFDFVPLPSSSKIISPLVEVLRKGNAKFRSCIVGSFSKGTLPYHKVASFAHKTWDSRGLAHISQKDSHTFIFCFNTVHEINSVLSRGTWFIERRPMLVYAWGTNSCKESHMPLWVKFEKIPDSYWTREFLSWLASSIGNPLYADAPTSKFEISPYAKMCVNYQIGDVLPMKLEVEVLDPVADEKYVESVLVSYPVKPLVCTACKSPGHLIGSCLKVTRQWIRKEKNSTAEAPGQPVVLQKPAPAPDPPEKPASIVLIETGHSSAPSSPLIRLSWRMQLLLLRYLLRVKKVNGKRLRANVEMFTLRP